MRPRRKPKELKVKWNPARRLYEPVLLEEHVLREIVERLWLQARVKVWRINQPVGGKTRQNEPGIPDLMGFIPRHAVAFGNGTSTTGPAILDAVPLFIEVKRPGGARRAAQERFIDEAKQGGCMAFFAESWTDVMREFYRLGISLSA